MNTDKLSSRLNLFPEYIFAKLAKEVELVEKTSKRKVLNLGAGSPDIPPSNININKLRGLLLDKDAHLYPGYKAIPEFRDALKTWYKTRFDVSLEKEEILPLLGAKDGISHLPLALLNEGDEILVPDPGYPSFTWPALLVGAKPINYSLSEENSFKIDLDDLKKLISGKTKAIWINFPSNPTGAVVTPDELEKIFTIAKKHNIWLIYDNAYSEITFDGFIAPSILEIKGAKEIAVEIGSFSKTFSFAGFRMGWIVGNKEIISSLAKVKSQMDSGLSLPLQRLGAFALTHFDNRWHKHMLANYQKRRDIIAKNLKTLGLTFSLPKGALYIWARIPDSEVNSEKFCLDLLQKRQILLTPGTAYGKNGEHFVRASICVNIDNITDYFK